MINLGLARISRLLRFLAKDRGAPEYLPPWKAIHIAGTNGKGSVAAYISAFLNRTGITAFGKDHESHAAILGTEKSAGAQAELRDGNKKNNINVGRFTSPHFIDSWDCIQINNTSVSRQAFERVSTRIASLAAQVEQEQVGEILPVHSQAERHQAQHNSRLTEFELLTATAFELFSDLELGPCSVSVIECGLGGRLDATNALPSSAIQLSVITRIGLDHLDVLGGSLQSIVREKCGILRKGVPVVVDGDNDPDVLDMIRSEVVRNFGREQAEMNLHIARADDLDKFILESLPEASHIMEGESLHVLNLMPHQKSNLAVALKACEVLETQHDSSQQKIYPTAITVKELDNTLADASSSYPGRLQWLQPGWLGLNSQSQYARLNASTILLDGAHNEQSARVLRACVDNELRKMASSPRPVVPKKSIASVYDDFADHSSPNSNASLSTARPFSDLNSSPAHHNVNSDPPSRKVIWVLAMSSGKDIFSLLETLIRSPHDEIVLATFGPVQGMPWVKPTPLASLLSSAEVLDMQYHVKVAAGNIVEALDVVEELLAKYSENEHRTETENIQRQVQQQQQPPPPPPLVVVAGSLYLVSDFLRFRRDGREEFVRYWNEHAA